MTTSLPASSAVYPLALGNWWVTGWVGPRGLKILQSQKPDGGVKRGCKARESAAHLSDFRPERRNLDL